MKAAVFHGPQQDLTIEDIEVDAPRPHEVVVRTVATGVCHSDLHFVDGYYTMQTPAILGHEGAGIIEAVGDQVTYVRPGDHVICCLSAFCGQCDNCLAGRPYICKNSASLRRLSTDPPKYTWRGERVTQAFGLGSYAERMLVHENSVVKIREDMPLDRAALIGCGVTTGVGAALNTAQIEPGSSVAVFGCGGVGISVIQGARIAGARMIIAVDTVEAKLGSAKEMGATHVVDASSRDPVEAIKALTDGAGVEYSFEAIGNKRAAEQAYECLDRGGTATVIGMIPVGQKVEIDGASLLGGKRLQGSTMGSNRFRRDMPRYIDFYMQGTLKLDEMITRRGRLEDVNEAFRAMKAGEVVRTVLMFD
jgi:S-(hydroxymethyl)glutathione dehydrogenase/alcohol dehydrogenase